MGRIYELRQKEVINIRDGCRFGFLSDVDIDIDKGKIIKLIVPGPARFFGIFGREHEYRIPWDCIKQIGVDIILVDVKVDDVLEEFN